MNIEPLDILIACEESQEVCKAFRALGHNAFSCDLQPCSGGHPEWHIQNDVRKVLYSRKWDYVVAHPVCTRMANSGVRWLASESPREGYAWDEREGVYLRLDAQIWQDLVDGCALFNFFVGYGTIHGGNITIENPIPHKYAKRIIPAPSQIIQPWQHGHKKMKATCLWQYGVPLLTPSDMVGPPPNDKTERMSWQDVWLASPGPNRAKLRSKTYPGIAKAIATQYTDYLLKQRL